jgi:hypothetical protein
MFHKCILALVGESKLTAKTPTRLPAVQRMALMG